LSQEPSNWYCRF